MCSNDIRSFLTVMYAINTKLRCRRNTELIKVVKMPSLVINVNCELTLINMSHTVKNQTKTTNCLTHFTSTVLLIQRNSTQFYSILLNYRFTQLLLAWQLQTVMLLCHVTDVQVLTDSG